MHIPPELLCGIWTQKYQGFKNKFLYGRALLGTVNISDDSNCFLQMGIKVTFKWAFKVPLFKGKCKVTFNLFSSLQIVVVYSRFLCI